MPATGSAPSAAPPRPTGVLLLELLSTDRLAQDRSIGFPFLSGLAHELGVPCRWICFGYDPARQRPDRFTVGLDARDEERVRDAVRAGPVEVVVVSEEITAGLRRAIEGARPGVRIVTVGRPLWPERATVAEALGLPPGRDGERWRLQDAGQPRYACELANALARELRPFLYVAAGPECVYTRPVRANPAFAPLAAAGVELGTACSFCVRDDPRSAPSTPPVPLALRQIRAAARELPPERWSGTCVVRGVSLLFRLRAFVDGLLAEPLPPMTFLLSARVDEVVRFAPALDEALPRLARAGHAIHVGSMGAENLSDRENERLNKGVTAAQVERAVALLRGWERAFPGTFAFFEHGGLGHITFTPWTTLDDLEQNFAAMDRMGLEYGALFLGSRALLRPGTPLARLAEHDGLVASRFEDPAMARVVLAGCLKSGDPPEIPWRFAHPAVATIYSTLLRAVPELAGSLAGDPALAAVRELVDRIGAAHEGRFEHRTLAAALLRAARRSPAPGAPVARLERGLEVARGRRAARASSAVGRDRFHVLAGDACNNRCLFCMEGDTARRHGVTPERVGELLRAHAAEGEVMFTSGEPTLNPRLVEYVRLARACGYRRIGLTTNARRLGYRPYARQLVEAGLSHVVVSIHGPDARSHDAQTRTPGSFVQTLAGLEALSELRREHALTVHTSTVVGRRNVGRLADLYWLLRSFAVDQCVFNVMQPLGRAGPLVRSLVAPYPEVVREFARLVRSVGGGRPAVFLVDVPPCATERLPAAARGWVETAAFTEFGREGVPVERQTRVEKEQANREKRPECSACVHDAACLGVWRSYLEAYGWDGLAPVRPRERAGR